MYHVGVSNIFELLDDENDEEGGKKVVSSTPAKQQPTAPTTKGKGPAASTVKEAPRKAESTPAAKASAPPRDRTDRRPPRTEDKPRAERPPRRREPRPEGSGAPVGGERAERVERTDKGDRPPRVAEGGRGRRDNKDREFQARPNKRPYDRKSGTGRGKEVKKGGGGRANWGKDEEQWEETAPAEKQEETESKPEGEAKVETETASPAPPVAPVKEENEEDKKKREEEERKRKEEEEKEAKQMTLDDYLKKREAEKAEKGSIIPELPAPRKPGEGADKKDIQMWAQFTALKRDEEEEKNSPIESKKDKKKEPKKQAVPLDQVLNVQQPKKPRAGKPENSDRRRDFRDSPRGGKRRTGAAAPDVKDASSFPALNTKA